MCKVTGGPCSGTAHAASARLLTIPIETVYADIRATHGMHQPYRVEVSQPYAGVTRVVTERIERNVEVPATAWEK
jgi:hypothetical protein